MTVNLLKLPQELLETIVEWADYEDEDQLYPSETLASIRGTCKILERASHRRFLRYFDEKFVDPEDEGDMLILKAISTSPVYAAAVKMIVFIYKGNNINLLKTPSALHEIFTNFVSINHKLSIAFDPFGNIEMSEKIFTRHVMEFMDRILVVAAVSKLDISSILVQARPRDWDISYESLHDPRTSVNDTHPEFPWIAYDEIFVNLHNMLKRNEVEGLSSAIAPELIASYPTTGELSFNYLENSLKMTGMDTYHWNELINWINLLSPEKIEIFECGFDPHDLRQILERTQQENRPLRSLSISTSELYQGRTFDNATPSHIHCLLHSLNTFARELEYCHLESIYGARTTLESPAFDDTSQSRIEFTGKNKIRSLLTQLGAVFPGEDEWEDENEDEDDKDEDDDEDDDDDGDEGTHAQGQSRQYDLGPLFEALMAGGRNITFMDL